MVPDHKKVFQMRYSESQVDYYFKIGMSLLEFMDTRWNVDGDVSGIEYSFVYCVIKGYSGQDHVQVAAVIQLAVDTVQERHPTVKNVIIQSYNASYFASQGLIQFIFNMNTRLGNKCFLCCTDVYSLNHR